MKPYYEQDNSSTVYLQHGKHMRVRLRSIGIREDSSRSQAICLGAQPERNAAHRRSQAEHRRSTETRMVNKAPETSYWHNAQECRWVRAGQGASGEGSVEAPTHSCDGANAGASTYESGSSASHQWRARRQRSRESLPMSQPVPPQSNRGNAVFGVPRVTCGRVGQVQPRGWML